MSAINNMNIHQLVAAAIHETNTNPFAGAPQGTPGMHLAGGSNDPELSHAQYVATANDLRKYGGFSIRPFGPNTGGSPVDAYSVGMPQYRVPPMPGSEMGAKDLMRFARSSQAVGAFSHPDTVLGGWSSRSPGASVHQDYVDASRLYPRTTSGMVAAVQAGNAAGEHAVGVLDDEGNYAHEIDLNVIRGNDTAASEHEMVRAWASPFVGSKDRGEWDTKAERKKDVRMRRRNERKQQRKS